MPKVGDLVIVEGEAARAEWGGVQDVENRVGAGERPVRDRPHLLAGIVKAGRVDEADAGLERGVR